MLNTAAAYSFVLNCLPWYFAAVSVISAAVTVFDKLSAKVHGRRVPEKSLLILSVFGGSAAMYIIMLAIRHKTRKMKFMAGIPFIMLIQAAALILFFKLK